MILVAALSALAGGVLTWLIIYLTRDLNPESPVSSSENGDEPPSDLLRVVSSKSGPTVLIQGERRRHLREIQDRETGEKAIAGVRAVLSFAEGWLPAVRERGDAADDARRRDAVPAAAPRQGPASTPVASNSPGDPLRLVEEIDALLQDRLAEHPEFAEQGIRLARDVDGRVLIYVGREQYRSAEEIPDEAVGTFIRETIQIWESR